MSYNLDDMGHTYTLKITGLSSENTRYYWTCSDNNDQLCVQSPSFVLNILRICSSLFLTLNDTIRTISSILYFHMV